MQISSLPTLLQTFDFNAFSSFLTFSRSNNWQEGMAIVKASSMFLRNLLNWGTFKDFVIRNVICHLPCVNKLFLLQLAQATNYRLKGNPKIVFCGRTVCFSVSAYLASLLQLQSQPRIFILTHWRMKAICLLNYYSMLLLKEKASFCHLHCCLVLITEDIIVCMDREKL